MASASATIPGTSAATRRLVSDTAGAVRAVHESYLEAGADIITTNSFTATRIAQADYGFDPATVRELNVAAAPSRGAPPTPPNATSRTGRATWPALSVRPTGRRR